MINTKVYYLKGPNPQTQYSNTETADRLLTEDGNNLLLSSSYSFSSGNRVYPAPTISITPEIYYANDTPIGYTYNISLNGYASSVDLSSSNPMPSGVNDSFNKTLQAIQKIKNLFNFNNGILAVTDNNDKVLMSASGCIIKDINFEENDNNWINYAKYSITLESNEVQFNGCSGVGQGFGCSTLNIPSGLQNSSSPNLIDMTKYRVRSFNDGWSFTLSPENIYQNYSFSSNGKLFNLQNHFIEIEYKITAEGKNYTNFKSNDEVYLLPSWENAKNFCQNRLYNSVSKLIENILKAPDQTTLNSLFANPSGTSSFFYDSAKTNNISNSTYGVYNETISCDTSESDGSFNATYKAIIKKKNTDPNDVILSNNIHTITLAKKVQDDGKNREVSFSVDGEIKGLIDGGLILSSGILYLPSNGTLLVNNPNTTISRYEIALSGYNLIANSNGIIPDLATALGITFDSLTAKTCSEGAPQAASHSVTHNYNGGSISYSTEYTTQKACQGNSKITNVSITIDEPTPRIAEFVVPGKQNGPVIQRLGTDTTRYISVNIEGYDKTYGCGYPNPITIVDEICANGVDLPFVTGIPGLDTSNNGVRIKTIDNKFNYNRIDGSFSINRKYLVLNN